MNISLRRLVYDRDGGACQVCDDQVPWDYYELGHKVDRCAGGSDDLSNLCLMCILCNRYKPVHETLDEYEAWAALGGKDQVYREAVSAFLATLATAERQRVSDRTKRGLMSAKTRGAVLGTPANLDQAARARAIVVRQESAINQNRAAMEFAVLSRERGQSLRQIADALNSNGYTSRRGGRFYSCSIQRLLKRAADCSSS